MAKSELAKIYAVDEVRVAITRGRPVVLSIHAIGRVTSTGWSGGELSRYVYLVPPADGVQEFDFVARMPESGTIVSPVLTSISAHGEIADIDIADFWGPGKPLTGIRVGAVGNSKTVEIADVPNDKRGSAAMALRTISTFTEPTGGETVPGFEQDIKPLFRPQDVAVMQAIGGFNLHKYEDVKAKAEDILARLRINMPCDGLWPEPDVAKFEAWKNGGMPA